MVGVPKQLKHSSAYQAKIYRPNERPSDETSKCL